MGQTEETKLWWEHSSTYRDTAHSSLGTLLCREHTGRIQENSHIAHLDKYLESNIHQYLKSQKADHEYFIRILKQRFTVWRRGKKACYILHFGGEHTNWINETLSLRLNTQWQCTARYTSIKIFTHVPRKNSSPIRQLAEPGLSTLGAGSSLGAPFWTNLLSNSTACQKETQGTGTRVRKPFIHLTRGFLCRHWLLWGNACFGFMGLRTSWVWII